MARILSKFAQFTDLTSCCYLIPHSKNPGYACAEPSIDGSVPVLPITE